MRDKTDSGGRWVLAGLGPFGPWSASVVANGPAVPFRSYRAGIGSDFQVISGILFRRNPQERERFH
ncbi:hypothetical protein [Labrys sp. ZIDIC5]|uniref:hypothetical protein n=1 Tax=Labrys sedimenti TaxID=3106036 RepID=UPI002ACAC687|nr:hypothetical protein [Labrys sp. ZIDIC5]MDZ5449005.1 hypothetical protein [Labrys sp. ZIDIC5]